MFGYMGRKRRKEDFEKLVVLLVEGKDFRKKGTRFGEVCSAFNTSRMKLDNMFYDIVGMSGEDVLVCLRRRNHRIER